MQVELTSFNLEKAIGLPPEGIIFTRPEVATINPFLFSSDEFRTRLVLKDDQVAFDPVFLYDLFVISQAIDETINQNASVFPDIKDQVGKGEFRELVRLHDSEKMKQVQKNFIRTLKTAREDVEEQGRKVVMAFPIWGSLAIMRAMEREQIPQEVLQPADISGSLGTETGHAKAEKLAPELLDPEKVVFFPDDIFDTCVTLIELGIERAKVKVARNGLKINHDIFQDVEAFEDKMRLARKGLLSQEETVKVWKDLAELLWEVDIISAPFSIKNPPFADAVITLSTKVWKDPDSSDWDRKKAAIQGQLMFQTHYINPDNWIIGGRWEGIPLLDTKVSGKTVMDLLARDQEKYLITEKQLRNLQQAGLDILSFRAFSGLDGLWVFNPDGLNVDKVSDNFDRDLLPENQLVQLYAGYISAYAQKRWPEIN
ncbi:MAG: hypothetical protein UV73_C0007G0029 [Candidatus Gottesmanbacteria bacterium GW2011_GWA2_43_14]|uniref:Uncharacterized protein n=1 Tax=Candidatus Gottesmanbacteria bacterium GW2011_GWA2_43_14 TaxID=1618443 RepID=A0A0G1FRE6_9BACT|nr:MAG: hypothetical protein UV73_C0007G0029 [Candidatus Gottesmanbacteria bacterium GW2011_GWA2_43_14]